MEGARRMSQALGYDGKTAVTPAQINRVAT
jgi:citrate lyase beta subunit